MPLFLPTLARAPSGYLSHEGLAQRTARHGYNRFLNPDEAEMLINAEHHRLGWAWSYGDYGVNRPTLWDGVEYMREKGTFFHVGWDFNVPAGTAILASRPSVVIHIDADSERWGWGGRVIVRLKHDPIFIIFAHLDPRRFMVSVGQTLGSASIIGYLGTSAVNGGWFPHLHIQCMAARTWEKFSGRLDELDGYGRVEARHELLRMFPDPLPLLRVW